MTRILFFLLLSTIAWQIQAATDIAHGKKLSITCVACHGEDGNSTNPIWPKIAGQNQKYLLKQLHDFKAGNDNGRENAIMRNLIAPFSEQDLRDISAYFSSQTMSPGRTEEKYLEAGQRLYQGGDIKRGIPACSACHGPAGQGNREAGFPRLSGQHAPYLIQQLKAYRDNLRNNDVNNMMHATALKLKDADIAALAHYISGLHEATAP